MSLINLKSFDDFINESKISESEKQTTVKDTKLGDVFHLGILHGIMYVNTGKEYINLYTNKTRKLDPKNPITIIDKDTYEILSGEFKGKNYIKFALPPNEVENIKKQIESAKKYLNESNDELNESKIEKDSEGNQYISGFPHLSYEERKDFINSLKKGQTIVTSFKDEKLGYLIGIITGIRNSAGSVNVKSGDGGTEYDIEYEKIAPVPKGINAKIPK